MILTTLAELDEKECKQTENSFDVPTDTKKVEKNTQTPTEKVNVSNEESFLSGVRERVLVLFEGLQSPQNQNLDTKIDVTLNFLEFLLALIEERLKIIHNKKQ